MPTKSIRRNLMIPTAIADRLREEAEFLHVKSRFSAEDGTELKSTADLVRWVVHLYIEACEVGEGPIYEWEETDPVAVTMDSTTTGRWEYAIKYRFAENYHQLVGNALCWYFDRLDTQAEKDAALLRNMQSMNALRVIGYLRAKDYAALQPTQPV